VSGAKLDLQTLMWTRGCNFPISPAGEPYQMPVVRIAAGNDHVRHPAEQSAHAGGPVMDQGIAQAS
jgi:hypothetical protein